MSKLSPLAPIDLLVGLQEIKAFRANLGKKKTCICVVLVTGKTMFSQHVFTVMNKTLLVTWPNLFWTVAVPVPIHQVASVFGIALTAQDGRVFSSREILDHSIETAQACGLREIWIPGPFATLGVIERVRYGDIVLHTYTPLYCDTAYFTSIQGGITSLGFSVPVVGASIGWEKSLFRLVHEKTHAPPSDLTFELTQSPVYKQMTFRGHISLPDNPQTTIIEGKQWMLGLLTESKIPRGLSSKAVSYIPSLPAYICQENFLFPYDAFRRIGSTLTFYGELYPLILETADKTYDRAYKIRAIANV